MEKARRRELKASYRETLPEAGVYRLLNDVNGKSLIGSSPNLKNFENKLAFGKSQKSVSVLDHRLHNDAREFGIEAFSLEILERLKVTPETTQEQIRSDLAVLEQLWREKHDPDLLY